LAVQIQSSLQPTQIRCSAGLVSKFLGMDLQQDSGTVIAINELLERLRPTTIIELGTGLGGLTVCLGLWAYMNGCKTFSFDIRHRHSNNAAILRTLKVACVTANIFRRWRAIAGLMGSGVVLLLCDGGDKVKEFNLFAQFLKPGDVIMAHDYSKDGLGRHEIEHSDVANTCNVYNLAAVMEAQFEPYRWGVFLRL